MITDSLTTDVINRRIVTWESYAIVVFVVQTQPWLFSRSRWTAQSYRFLHLLTHSAKALPTININ
uniref:Transposase n=1 Tax=Heterorhabditis bacteriophora TaxID=37862 RepID=A0A1I7XLZ6_HETBA